MTTSPTLPAPWLDRTAYPFEPHVFETEHGRMHYVDEGDGPAIVLVHGTPTWSFLWRRFITALSSTYRVVAPDHLGFGLSDKPPGAPYRPEDHARRLGALIDALGLDTFVLAVHDFGGPIGLGAALERPEAVRGLVAFNTWCWSSADDPTAVRMSRVLGSRFGHWLYTRLNVSPRLLLPLAYADRSALTPDVHRQYLAPFPSAAQRTAPWVFARELIGSSAWYDDLWNRRDRLADVPKLFLWGERDPAFGLAHLDRWTQAFPDAHVRTFPDAGHFVQEEAPEAAVESVAAFLNEVPSVAP